MTRWAFILFLILGGCTTPSSVKHNLDTVPSIPTKIIINPNFTKYIVANIATMKLRVYQLPCDTCHAELIFTTEMVVGKDVANERTKPGFYKIQKWVQFHEDYEKRYLAWNKNPPPPNSPRSKWGVIGAFGWYAAIIDPLAGGQWLHGTLGWSSDEENFITPTVNERGNWVRHKSHGCTRISNPAISFLRDHVPPGSYLFRIYAKEEVVTPQITKEVSWEHQLIYKQKVLDKGQWVREVKTEAFPIFNKENKKSWIYPNNPYELPVDSLGTFIVDKGQIKNYQHPNKFKAGGLPKPPQFFIFKEYE